MAELGVHAFRPQAVALVETMAEQVRVGTAGTARDSAHASRSHHGDLHPTSRHHHLRRPYQLLCRMNPNFR